MNRFSKKSTRPILLIFLCLLLLPMTLPAQQEVDKEYTQKILEYTTEKFFLTELVDHLPASPTIPNPKEILGKVIGAPDILHYTDEINRYMKAVADKSPRVIAFSSGLSDEGKEMITVAVSDEKNIERLKRIKKIMTLLADPRKIEESEADNLIAEGIPIYWITGALHSSECGSPEMLMELVYRLAVDEKDFWRNRSGYHGPQCGKTVATGLVQA